MILCDVNVLVYAFKQDEPRHEEYVAWLDRTVNGDEPYGVSELVLLVLRPHSDASEDLSRPGIA